MKPYLIACILLFLGLCCFWQLSNAQKRKRPHSTIIRVLPQRDTFTYFSILDTNYGKYKLPAKFKKPVKWMKRDSGRSKDLGDRYGGNYADSFDLQDALALIDTATDLSVGSAKSWCMKNYIQAFPYLVARLTDKRKIGLKNTADLIIWDRLGTGDLKFQGHGGVISEDIFTVAGRASWILNEITGEDFAEVHADLSKTEAQKFKTLWSEYLSKLKE